MTAEEKGKLLEELHDLAREMKCLEAQADKIVAAMEEIIPLHKDNDHGEAIRRPLQHIPEEEAGLHNVFRNLGQVKDRMKQITQDLGLDSLPIL